MISNEWISRRRHQRGQPRKQLDRRHHPVRDAVAGVLHAVRDAAVAEQDEPIKGEARPSAVADEALAPLAVVGLDADRRLEVEAVALGGERAALLRLEARIGVARA